MDISRITAAISALARASKEQGLEPPDLIFSNDEGPRVAAAVMGSMPTVPDRAAVRKQFGPDYDGFMYDGVVVRWPAD